MNIERRRVRLPSKRVIRLASTMIVLNSAGVWVAVSLPDWPDLEVEMSFKLSQPGLPAAYNGLTAPAELRIQ